MVEQIQEMTENVTMKLVNKSGRTISKLNVQISREKKFTKSRKKSNLSENPLSSNKMTFLIGEETQMNENLQQNLKTKNMKFSMDPRNQKDIRKPNPLILPQKEIFNCQKV